MLVSGRRIILKCVSFHKKILTAIQIGFSLKKKHITDSGLKVAGDVDPLPTDPQELINLWCNIIGEATGTARMLRVLGEQYPDEISREQLGEAVNMSSTSGSFGTYLSFLRSRGLIKTTGQNIKASDELFL